jgi:hypothetical protein
MYAELLQDQQDMIFKSQEADDGQSIKGIIRFFDDDLADIVLKTYITAGLEFGNELLVETRSEDDDLERSIRQETKILKEVSLIQDATADKIGEQIREGLQKGWAPATFQQAVKDCGIFSDMRALRISRTMTGAGASQAQWLNALTSGATHKIWKTAGDSLVRDIHSSINGQKVGINDRFSNGGRYPLDSLLSAAQRVNCRCSLMFELNEEDNDYGAKPPPEDPMMVAQSAIACCDQAYKEDFLVSRPHDLKDNEPRRLKRLTNDFKKLGYTGEKLKTSVRNLISSANDWESSDYEGIRNFQKGIGDSIEFKKSSDALEEYLHKGTQFDPKTTLYRGLIDVDIDDFSNLKAGDVVEDVMSSWTSDSDLALDFAGGWDDEFDSVVFKLEGGAPNTSSLSNINGNSNEYEVLVSGTERLEIIKIVDIVDDDESLYFKEILLRYKDSKVLK